MSTKSNTQHSTSPPRSAALSRISVATVDFPRRLAPSEMKIIRRPRTKYARHTLRDTVRSEALRDIQISP
eukprot:scaffold120555_cov28-Tisochrysis_lutea.AAC.2